MLVYDANGSLIGKTEGSVTTTYDYDAENRLVGVKQGTTVLASFAYDGEGKRVQKTSGGVTHTYVYDEQNFIEERLSSGQTYDYVQGPGIDQPLAQRDQAGMASYYLADHLGSIAQMTNSAGEVTLTREYDPWGNLLQGSTTAGYAFTGREWDPEIPAYYYRARYYDSTYGRFISEDPIGLRAGPNLYAYVEASPVSGKDPLGTTCGSNVSFFFQWLGGGAMPCEISYADTTIENQEMQNSPGAAKLRAAFKANRCNPVKNVNFGTVEAYYKTILSPCSTGFQVGGFSGGSAVPVGQCNARYTIWNDAGAHSFFLHGPPNVPTCFLPMHTVRQWFSWTEPSPCKSGHCGC